MKTNYQTEEEKFAGKFNRRLFKTLYYAYKPYLLKLLLLAGLGLLGRLFLLGNANLISLFVDYQIPTNKEPLTPEVRLDHLALFDMAAFFSQLSLVNFLSLTFLFFLVGFIFTAFFRIGFSRYSAEAISRIYDEVTLRTSRLPIPFFDRTPNGRIITRFSSDYGTVFRMFGGPLAEFVAIIFDLIALSFLIVLASPYYVILVIFLALSSFVIWKTQQQSLRAQRRKSSLVRSPSIAHFAETAQGAETIRTYLKQEVFFSRFDQLNDLHLKEKEKTFVQVMNFSFFLNLASILTLFIAGVLSYFLLQKGLVSIGDIGVAMAFLAFSTGSIQFFFDWLAQFEEALVGLERLDSYLNKEIENGECLPYFDKGNPSNLKDLSSENLRILKESFNKIKGQKSLDLYFKIKSFSYNKDQLQPTLRDLNFQVKAGEKLGVIGKTGSGKSSLISCLFQFYPIQEGEILIGGYKPKLNLEYPALANEVLLSDYRTLIAYVTQDTVLLKGPLRDNLDFLKKFTDTELFEALAQVGLKDWVEKKPEGLNFYIEEKGKNLSAGEKQLISIARTLLLKTPIVVLDEATSNVDPLSEEILVQNTQEIFKGKTQIIIAHRLSTIQNCDRILWLEGGRMKSLGRTAEILEQFKNGSQQLDL